MSHNKSLIRVLHIEDHPGIQMFMSQILRLLGYEVACESNGKLGVEKALTWLPDIILTDLRMPVMDGLEVIQFLRQQPHTAHIPIFVLSAYGDASTREKCRLAGANHFFIKTVDVEMIHQAIQDTLKVKMLQKEC